MKHNNVPTKPKNNGLVQARIPKEHIKILHKNNVDVPEFIRLKVKELAEYLNSKK